MESGTWNHVERVLAVRLDALGDVLMTTPALRAVKHSAPRRRMTLWTSPQGAEAARLVPEIDDILPYEAPWMKAAPPRRDAQVDLHMLGRLRQGKYDAAVIFTSFSQSPLPAALMCRLAGIPRRAAHCRENPYQLLTTWVQETEPHQGIRHEVQRQLDLVRAIGCRAEDERMSLRVGAEARRRVRTRLACIGLDRRRPWCVVHPGATAASRRWPVERFAETVRCLVGDHALQVVLTGTAAERPLVEALRAQAGVAAWSLAGELSLEELAALLAAAPVLLCNNTGPAHLAAAVGAPVVCLYALTNPQHTPWRTAQRVLFHDVVCKYCFKSQCPQEHHLCLRGVMPQQVVAAVLELLARDGRRRLQKEAA